LPQALADCNEALELWPNNAHFLNSRGLVELKLARIMQPMLTDVA
jgi:hypothetical protein